MGDSRGVVVKRGLRTTKVIVTFLGMLLDRGVREPRERTVVEQEV